MTRFRSTSTPAPRPRRAPCASILAVLAVVTVPAGCGDAPDPEPGGEAASPTSAIDADALAALLAERVDVQPGERVLFVARPGRFVPVIAALRDRLRADGAEDLGVVGVGADATPEAWSTDFTRSLGAVAADSLAEVLSDVDLGLMFPGATPADPAYAALQDVLRSERGRTVHFHWAGAYDVSGVEGPVDARVDETYVRSLLETDYDGLARDQRSFEEAMREGEVRVTTPAGTDVRFRIGDRPVTRQDGDASALRAAEGRNLIDREVELPAGAIRVAPLEESVNGRIAFPPTVWGDDTVEGLVLTLENGRVTDVDAERGEEAVLAEMDAAGPAGRAFREFALGFNPTLAMPEGPATWIPYYGYGAGVVRLSLGDNTELGGAVGGGYVRWNFFTDATVTVGGEVWVDGGRRVR